MVCHDNMVDFIATKVKFYKMKPVLNEKHKRIVTSEYKIRKRTLNLKRGNFYCYKESIMQNLIYSNKVSVKL